MRFVDLFSGTGCVGSVFASAGWEVVSLDSDPRTVATIQEDILTRDYTTYPLGYFNAIWASTCCAHYSRADSLVLHTLEFS